jgi:hypothetical protein
MSKWRRDDPLATWKYVAAMQAKIQKALAGALRARVTAQLPTVYDNTNLTRNNRASVLRIAGEAADVRYVVLDRPLAAKIADRGWRPEALVREQHRRFQDELPDILAGDGQANVVVEDKRLL